jgi:hypothetical protein
MSVGRFSLFGTEPEGQGKVYCMLFDQWFSKVKEPVLTPHQRF